MRLDDAEALCRILTHHLSYEESLIAGEDLCDDLNEEYRMLEFSLRGNQLTVAYRTTKYVQPGKYASR